MIVLHLVGLKSLELYLIFVISVVIFILKPQLGQEYRNL